MKVIIDERETALYDKCYSILCARPTPSFAVISKEVLDLGDILIQTDDGKDVLLIERKSFSDLLASIKDGRYEEQSYRLLNASGFPPHSIIYLLEGMFSQLRTPMEKKIILSATTSLQFFKGFSTHRTLTVAESAEWILHMADKLDREMGNGKIPYYLSRPFLKYFSKISPETSADGENQDELPPIPPNNEEENYCSVVKKVRKANITPANIGEIILCTIPGISSITAISIMKQFTNFSHFMQEIRSNPDCIEKIVCENNGKQRKISKAVVESIRNFLVQEISQQEAC